MSPRIEPRSPRCEVDERQRKKARTATPINGEQIGCLIDIGVSNFYQCEHHLAEASFSLALSKIYGMSMLVQHAPSSLTSSVVRSSTPTLCSQEPTLKLDLPLPMDDAIVATKEVSPSALNPPQQAQKLQEYDEGMHVFRQPLYPHDDINSITATLFYNIGLTHTSRGQYEGAKLWFLRSLSTRQTCPDFGRVNTMDAMILHNIGYCVYRIGLKDEALQYFEHALAIIILVEEDGPPVSTRDLAASLNCIGVIKFHNGEEDSAMELLQRSLEIYRARAVGKDLVETATVLNNVGRVHFNQERHNKALSSYKEALDIREQLLGSMAIDTAATQYNLAMTYHALGEVEKAIECYKLFIRILRSRLGEDAPELAFAYRGIAEIYQEECELLLAMRFYKQALHVQKVSLGERHPDVGSTLNRLGNVCYSLKDYHASLQYYEKGLEVEKSNLAKKNHPDIIVTLTNIAHVHKQMGQYGRALMVYRQVKAMQEQSFGAESLAVAESMSNIGLVQYHMKDLDGAFDSYQAALRVRRELYETDEHPDIASTLNSVGLILYKQDMFDLAKQCFTQCVSIRQKIFGKDNNREVAIAWYNLATVHFEMGQDDVAVQLYKEAIRVERKALGSDDPDVVVTIQHLAQLFQRLGRLNEATEYYLEALGIERKRKETNHGRLGNILNLLGNVYLQLGKTKEMMACFVEASRIYEAQQLPRDGVILAGYNQYGLSKTNPPCAAMA